MKIKEVMQHIKDRELPCVSKTSDLSDVVKVATGFPHTRLVYVLDDQKKLLGVITIDALMHHLYPYYYEAKIHPRGILRNITAEKAVHVMSSEGINASPDETIDVVLKRMASRGANEISIVDSNGCLLTAITAVDLLKYYQL
jgi:CBS-domain-containing membrane protein